MQGLNRSGRHALIWAWTITVLVFLYIPGLCIFLASLTAAGVSVEGRSVYLLGAGGAARAIADGEARRRAPGYVHRVDGADLLALQPDWPSLQGPHNLQNAAVAVEIVEALGLVEGQWRAAMADPRGDVYEQGRKRNDGACGGVTEIVSLRSVVRNLSLDCEPDVDDRVKHLHESEPHGHGNLLQGLPP